MFRFSSSLLSNLIRPDGFCSQVPASSNGFPHENLKTEKRENGERQREEDRKRDREKREQGKREEREGEIR